MISDFYASAPPTLDAFPQSIVEDYDNLWYIVKEYHDRHEDDLIFYIDSYLSSMLKAEMQLRYMCRIAVGRPGVESLLSKANRHLPNGFEAQFISWFAIRIVEVLTEYTGNPRLRQLRKDIAAEWQAVERLTFHTIYGPLVDRLLRFTFTVLIPLVASNIQPKSVAPIIHELKRAIPVPSPPTRIAVKVDAPLQTLDSICSQSFSSKDVRELLQQLGVLDISGFWHLGTLTGKAAKPLSAFPAVYRALVEAGLMDRLDGPAWRKLFEEEFRVSFSDRLANYAWGGKTSLEFERYYSESKRWVSKRKTQ